MKHIETNCPDCKEYIDQILQLKKILTDNNEKMSDVELEKDAEIEALEEVLESNEEEIALLWKLLKIEKERNE